MKWTIDDLQKESNKTRYEFYIKNPNAYNAASKKKLIDDLFKNHINKGFCRKKWLIEELQEEANKYKTRYIFYKKNPKAYSAAYKQNLIDKLFENHINYGYSDKNEYQVSNYVIYIYELPDFNNAYIGLTKNIKRRDQEHIFNFNEKLNIFCKKNNISLPKYKILEDNLKSNTAQEREKYWIDYYKNNGWKMFNIKKAGSLGGTNIKWTKKALQQEINKYLTRKDLAKNNNVAYNAAFKLNILDELFKNHINNGYSTNKVPRNHWTKENLQQEINKYSTRRDLEKNNKGAYNAASELNILDELFKNHINNGYSIKKVKKYHWTIENIKKEADKYMTMNDFLKNNKCAYKAAFRLHILNDLFKDKPNQGYKIKKSDI